MGAGRATAGRLEIVASSSSRFLKCRYTVDLATPAAAATCASVAVGDWLSSRVAASMIASRFRIESALLPGTFASSNHNRDTRR